MVISPLLVLDNGQSLSLSSKTGSFSLSRQTSPRNVLLFNSCSATREINTTRAAERGGEINSRKNQPGIVNLPPTQDVNWTIPLQKLQLSHRRGIVEPVVGPFNGNTVRCWALWVGIVICDTKCGREIVKIHLVKIWSLNVNGVVTDLVVRWEKTLIVGKMWRGSFVWRKWHVDTFLSI